LELGAGRVVIACRAVTALSWATVALSTNDWAGWSLFGFGQFLFRLSMGAENANESGLLADGQPGPAPRTDECHQALTTQTT
jgi:hypothetical protein